jgi:hypothetical protein
LNTQAIVGAGVGNQTDDHFVADQGPSTPILGDMTEHPTFNFVPFTSAGRKVADMDGHFQPRCHVLQRDLPQSAAAVITPATVCCGEQMTGSTMSLRFHYLPPTTNGFRREPGGIVINADAHPALVAGNITDAIRNDFDQLQSINIHLF